MGALLVKRRPDARALIPLSGAVDLSGSGHCCDLFRRNFASNLVSSQLVVRCSPRHADRHRDSLPHDLGH